MHKTHFDSAEWLIKTIQACSCALTVEQALHEVVEQVKEFIPHHSLAVIMQDQKTDGFVIKTARHISYSFIKKFQHPAKGEIIQRVMLKHETLVFNALDSSRPEYQEIKLESDVLAIILTPIIHSQRAIGYLHCARATENFTATESRWLQLLGLLIGQLIEKFDLLVLSRHLARVDETSKALKYHAFLEEYRKELSRAQTNQTALSLMFLGVNDYTGFLQTCGIEAAHCLLEKIHSIIRENVREIDVIGRFSLDEFIVCQTGISEEKVLETLGAIKEKVQKFAAPKSGCKVSLDGVAMTLTQPGHFKLPMNLILTALGSGLIAVRTRGREQMMSIDPPTQ